MNKEAYYHNLHTYQEYEEAYLSWATWRKLFNKRLSEKYYYSKGQSREVRLKQAKQCASDFPFISCLDLYLQIGGCEEKGYPENFDFWHHEHEPFEYTDKEKLRIYARLSSYPDEIYDAIEDVYKWSILIHVRTSVVEEKLADVIKFIATNCV